MLHSIAYPRGTRPTTWSCQIDYVNFEEGFIKSLKAFKSALMSQYWAEGTWWTSCANPSKHDDALITSKNDNGCGGRCFASSLALLGPPRAPGYIYIYTRLGSWVYLLGYSCIASKNHCLWDGLQHSRHALRQVWLSFHFWRTRPSVFFFYCNWSLYIIYIYKLYIYIYNFCDLASRIQQLWLFCWWWPRRFKIQLQ